VSEDGVVAKLKSNPDWAVVLVDEEVVVDELVDVVEAVVEEDVVAEMEVEVEDDCELLVVEVVVCVAWPCCTVIDVGLPLLKCT
jgi:hypothetical protein